MRLHRSATACTDVPGASNNSPAQKASQPGKEQPVQRACGEGNGATQATQKLARRSVKVFREPNTHPARARPPREEQAHAKAAEHHSSDAAQERRHRQNGPPEAAKSVYTKRAPFGVYVWNQFCCQQWATVRSWIAKFGIQAEDLRLSVL